MLASCTRGLDGLLLGDHGFEGEVEFGDLTAVLKRDGKPMQAPLSGLGAVDSTDWGVGELAAWYFTRWVQRELLIRNY